MLSFKFKNKIFGLIGEYFGFSLELAVRDMYIKLLGNKGIDNMHSIQRGLKNGKRYYILRYQTNIMGLAAVMRDAIFVKKLAVNKGYELLIWFGTGGLVPPGGCPKMEHPNLWEKLFEQHPTVDEVMANASNCVVVSPINARGMYDRDFMKSLSGDPRDAFYFYGVEEGRYYRSILRNIFSKCCNINESIVEEFNKQCEMLNSFAKGDKLIGVLMREHFSEECLKGITDEEHLKVLSYHPRVPGVDEIIGVLKSVIEKTGTHKVFVATLYNETIKRLKEELGDDNVYYIDRNRLDCYEQKGFENLYDYDVTYEDVSSGKASINEANVYEQNKTYLLELFLLSKCDVFVSPKCGGGFMVPLMREVDFDEIIYLEQNNCNCVFK